MNGKLRAACGINCENCPAYIARINNDCALREKTAHEWNKTYGANFTAEQINCVGCLVDGEHSGYCFACPIRACVIKRKLPHCYACSDFKTCATRIEFETHGGIKIESFFTK